MLCYYEICGKGRLMKKIFTIAFILVCFGPAAFASYPSALHAVQKGDYATALLELEDPLASEDAKAQYLMAYMYYHGLGVARDYKKAFDLFEASSEQGNMEALTFLAYMYDEGKGVAINKKKAFDLYQTASEKGDVTATMNLGVLFYQGNGVPQNYEKAFDLLSSVENVRNPIVQYYLGNFYFYGYGVPKDAQKAFPYYVKSAQYGSVEAHYLLGHLYQNGIGTQGDASLAMQYYEYAAMMNFPQAQFNLATMYADGANGSVDKVMAYAWLSKAVENGVDGAKNALSALSDSMSMGDISAAKKRIMELNMAMVNPNVRSPAGVAADIAEALGMPVSEESAETQADPNAPAAKKKTARSKRMVRRR